MSRRNRKLTLLFKADVAVVMQPLNHELEKLVKEILGDEIVDETKVPCG